MTSQAIIDKIVSQKKEFRRFGVNRLGLFGSVVRNEANAKSDIDVLVEFDPAKKTFRNFIGTAEFMENLTGRSVDLITKESLSPYFRPHVLKEILYVKIAA